MKKILFGVLFTLISVASFAQAGVASLTSDFNKSTLDTVVNTGIRTQTTKAVSDFYDVVGIGVTVRKLTGTANGVIRLQGSYDGVNFFRVLPTDSLIVSNTATTNNKGFHLTAYPYVYLRVQYTGIGTATAEFKSVVKYKKK